MIAKGKYRLIAFFVDEDQGSTTKPRIAIAKSHPDRPVPRDAVVRDVVLTETLKVAGAVPLTFAVLGSIQEAPLGAPVQVSVAVPLIPAPPIDSVYIAEFPAVKVAVLELPDGTPRLRFGTAPSPVNSTVCGEPGALSMIDSMPVRLAVAVGEKTMEIAQGAILPQSFISEKSPVTAI
jgi:hypothetical protein